MRDGERVVDRRAVEVVDAAVERVVEAQQFGDHLPHPAGEPADVRLREERLVRDVEPDHRHVDAAREDPGGGFGIAPDVELGRRRDVPLCDRAAHQDDALGPCIWMEGEQQRDVRQRPDRDQRHRPVGVADRLCEELDGVLVHRLALRRRQIGTVETRLAVDVRGDELLAYERPVRACGDGDISSSRELEHAERIRRRLVERLIAGDARDAEQLHLRRGECEQQRDRVVVPRVAVDEDRRRSRAQYCVYLGSGRQ